VFIRTTAINKLLALNKFVKGVQGGSSAGKTFGILPIEINHAASRPNLEISVVSESIPHLKRGAIRDFKKIMTETGRWNPDRWNATDFRYTFANGSFIEFFSADSPDKMRGPRRDRLYMNEANNMPFETYLQLGSRTRESIFLDWNPTSEFWFHTDLMHDSDTDFIILTYLDNEACPDQARKWLEKAKEKAETSEYWRNYYRVYGLGEVGSLQGVVFSNWSQVDEVPQAFRRRIYGLDWGFSNDHTAVVEVTIANDTDVYLRQVMYERGLINTDIANRLQWMKGSEIIADSAEPKSIEELRRHGFRIRPTVKGPDSVRAGIAKMQGLRMFVTSDSIDLIRELRSYCWQTDKAGAATNEPEDANNHAIDAARYAIMEVLKARSGTYSIR
jgi:phage terminase large subunit